MFFGDRGGLGAAPPLTDGAGCYGFFIASSRPEARRVRNAIHQHCCFEPGELARFASWGEGAFRNNSFSTSCCHCLAIDQVGTNFET
jgi:hypothetical protein